MSRLGVSEWLIICIPVLILAGILGIGVLVWLVTKKGSRTDKAKQPQTQGTEGMADHNLMSMLEMAASAIAARPDQQLVRWVIYFLQALDEKVYRDVCRQMLENVRDAINARLEAGKW